MSGKDPILGQRDGTATVYSGQTATVVVRLAGQPGPQGPPGAGVAAGGAAGKVLAKKSATDYDTLWVDNAAVPTGGTTGQLLSKLSATDFDAAWVTVGGVPVGGAAGQVLSKKSGTNYDTQWTALPPVTIADTAEVDLSGDGAGTPLSAALTGLRNGNFTVSGGDLVMGADTDTTGRRVWFRWKDGANRIAWLWTPYPGNNLVLECYVNDVKISSCVMFLYTSLTIVGAINASKGIVINDTSGTGDYWANGIQNYRTINAKVTGYAFGQVDENMPLGVQLRTNGTDRGRLDFVVDPATNRPYLTMYDIAGGVTRPIPYAMWAGRADIVLSSATNGTVAFTLPTGRFNASLTPPGNSYVVTATAISQVYSCYLSAATLSSLTIGIRHVDNTAASVTVAVMAVAVQMTPTTGPG